MCEQKLDTQIIEQFALCFFLNGVLSGILKTYSRKELITAMLGIAKGKLGKVGCEF